MVKPRSEVNRDYRNKPENKIKMRAYQQRYHYMNKKKSKRKRKKKQAQLGFVFATTGN